MGRLLNGNFIHPPNDYPWVGIEVQIDRDLLVIYAYHNPKMRYECVPILGLGWVVLFGEIAANPYAFIFSFPMKLPFYGVTTIELADDWYTFIATTLALTDCIVIWR
jgi:hypothetical protein